MQDIHQTVFTDLARKAGGLAADTVLGGWLYRHACFTAAKAIRTERRRQARERQAVEMNAQNDPSDAVWRQLAPLLDEAMGRLNAADRDAIVLRFFERQPFRVVGGALGTSEEGARKRVDRALEKLRGSFGRRGVSVSALALAESLSSQAVTLAPAGMGLRLCVGRGNLSRRSRRRCGPRYSFDQKSCFCFDSELKIIAVRHCQRTLRPRAIIHAIPNRGAHARGKPRIARAGGAVRPASSRE